MCLNQTSEWKDRNIWISWELLLFYFEHLDDISWASIVHPCQKLWSFELAKSYYDQFRACRYVMCLNRTSEGKVMTIWISRELLLFYFKRFDISWTSIVHPCQKLWPFGLDHSFCVQFRASRYIMCLNRTFEWKGRTIWISWELPLFYFKHFDISWASIVHPCQKLWPFELDQSFHVQFRPCRYIMCLNWTSEWKVMSIWISREHSLFNF